MSNKRMQCSVTVSVSRCRFYWFSPMCNNAISYLLYSVTADFAI